MIQPIILYGDSMLRQRSGEIPREFPNINDLINDMFETMHRANGVGLSAVQIGIPLRIFIIEAHLEKEDFHFRQVFINPVITKKWGSSIKFTEGCLSIPGITASVERPEKIEISFYDENWEQHNKVYDGFASRIIQHEYDHLEGILFIDKLDTLWRYALEESIKEIEERKLEVNYLIK